MSVVPDESVEFDESKFNFIMDLAGPANARHLASRLEADLTRISDTMMRAAVSADHQSLRAQSHNLLGIAGTIGANRLYHLSLRLNTQVQSHDGGPLGDLIAEVHALLDRLINRIRSTPPQTAADP